MAGGIAAIGMMSVAEARALMSAAPALETWTKSAEEVRDWAATAKAGDTFVYARDRHITRRNSLAAAAVGALCDGGFATTYTKPIGGGISEYVVHRLKVAKRVSIGHDRRASDGPKYDGDMSRMLRVLRVLAGAMPPLPCPPNRELAKQARLGNANQASYVLKKLVKAQAIAVEIVNEATGERIVTLSASGEQTAAPK